MTHADVPAYGDREGVFFLPNKIVTWARKLGVLVRKNAEDTMALLAYLLRKNGPMPEAMFTLDRRALAGKSGCGLSEGRTRGAIETMAFFGIVERMNIDQPAYKLDGTKHRRPIWWRWSRTFVRLLVAHKKLKKSSLKIPIQVMGKDTHPLWNRGDREHPRLRNLEEICDRQAGPVASALANLREAIKAKAEKPPEKPAEAPQPKTVRSPEPEAPSGLEASLAHFADLFRARREAHAGRTPPQEPQHGSPSPGPDRGKG